MVEESQAKLCSCIALVRGLTVPSHGLFVALLHAFTILVGDSHEKLRVCMICNIISSKNPLFSTDLDEFLKKETRMDFVGLLK